MNEIDQRFSRCVVERNVPATMRDGTILRSDVYRPADDERHPVLLGRTQYGKSGWGRWIEPERTAGEDGYVVVVNDMRGQFASDGEFDPFRWDVDDGYDMVEWCADQAWSNGRVGMFGSSSCGFAQLLAAVARPPHLVAIAPFQTWSSFGRGCIYEPGGGYAIHSQDWAMLAVNIDPERRLSNGVAQGAERRQAASRAAWEIERWHRHRPLSEFPPLDPSEAPWYYRWLDHPDDDEWWADRDVTWRYDRITIPAFHLVGWFDRFARSTVRNFESIARNRRLDGTAPPQRLVIGPWPHGVPVITASGDRHFGPDAGVDARALTLGWYDRWLKEQRDERLDEPAVRIYVLGRDAWRDEREWPLARTKYTAYYLHGDGRANTSTGDGVLSPDPPGDEPPDTYRSDPADPVPSVPGGRTRPSGPVDQRTIEERDDVLVYTTEALAEAVEVTGPIVVHLFAATDGPDTDWTIKLVDVEPDGYCLRLSDGMIRARYRETQARAILHEPGRVYEYEITMSPTANLFRAGHRIRVEVASASFPQFDANMNTGGPFATERVGRIAVQHVFHDRARPSHVVLPIIPG